MSASNYLEAKLLDHVLKVAAFTQPANLYMALHSADPTDVGNVAEASGGAYARQTVAFGAAASPSGVSANTGIVTFTMPAGTWTFFSIQDAVTAGNALFIGALTASKTTLLGDQIAFAVGAVTVTCD